MLISFDGLDSSGKATQVKQLISRLKKEGFGVYHQQTPDYSTPTGQDLKLRLQGKKGDWRKTPWQEKARFFAQNRAEHKAEVLAALAKGEVVVYDRYIPSSLAFVTVEALTENPRKHTREEIQEWVEKLERDEFGMPQENLSFFLDMSPQLADSLLHKRKKNNHDEDEYTDHLFVQAGLYREYEILTGKNPTHYLRINCVNKSGSIKSITEIAETIWQKVSPKL